MPVEIKITADTMDELWAMLSTFNVPRVHAGHLSEEDLKRLVTDTSQTIVSSAGNGEDVAVPAHTRGEKEVPAHSKRGPGRPPGAKNKPVKAAPEPEDDDDDPQPEAVPEADEDADPEATKQMLVGALTVHWKENVKAKRDAVDALKDEIGIKLLSQMKPKDFPKARATLKTLDAMGSEP